MLLDPASWRVTRRERRLLRRLIHAGAVVPDRAHPVPAFGDPSTAWLKRLEALGLVYPVSDGRYYVNEQAYERMRRAWLTHSVITLLVMLVLVGGLALLLHQLWVR